MTRSQLVPWLHFCYWFGAVLDLLAGMTMLFPAVFTFLNRLPGFQPGNDYRYAMGMGAPLMLAWTVLLLWADRKPLERKDILLITLLVVAGEAITQIWGVSAAFVPLRALLPTFGIQAILGIVYILSYINARKAVQAA